MPLKMDIKKYRLSFFSFLWDWKPSVLYIPIVNKDVYEIEIWNSFKHFIFNTILCH